MFRGPVGKQRYRLALVPQREIVGSFPSLPSASAIGFHSALSECTALGFFSYHFRYRGSCWEMSECRWEHDNREGPNPNEVEGSGAAHADCRGSDGAIFEHLHLTGAIEHAGTQSPPGYVCPRRTNEDSTRKPSEGIANSRRCQHAINDDNIPRTNRPCLNVTC